jgi:hypothetical protein
MGHAPSSVNDIAAPREGIEIISNINRLLRHVDE